jgi:hypothetical protein
MHRSCHNPRVKNERENAAKPGFFHDRRKKWFDEDSLEMNGCTLERTGVSSNLKPRHRNVPRRADHRDGTMTPSEPHPWHPIRPGGPFRNPWPESEPHGLRDVLCLQPARLPGAVDGPRRVMDPGLALERLPPLHLILLSHDHYDHLDRRAL